MIENDLGWLPELFETGYCVTLARGLASAEILTRMGAELEPPAKLTLAQAARWQIQLPWEQSVARAGVHRGWGYAVENTGTTGADEVVLRRVSVGTQALVLVRAGDATNQFTYAEDGEIVCSFDPATPRARRGRDPDRLLSWMERLHLMPRDRDHPMNHDAAMLTIARDAFGATLPREPVESGRLRAAVVGR